MHRRVQLMSATRFDVPSCPKGKPSEVELTGLPGSLPGSATISHRSAILPSAEVAETFLVPLLFSGGPRSACISRFWLECDFRNVDGLFAIIGEARGNR